MTGQRLTKFQIQKVMILNGMLLKNSKSLPKIFSKIRKFYLRVLMRTSVLYLYPNSLEILIPDKTLKKQQTQNRKLIKARLQLKLALVKKTREIRTFPNSGSKLTIVRNKIKL